MTTRTAILTLIAALLACDTLEAQRRRRGPRFIEPIPSWGVEASFRVSVLKDDAVSYVGARVGRQLDSKFNIGIGGSMLLTPMAESFRIDGYERVTSLVYIGPSIELRDSLRGPVRFLLRVGSVVGLAGFSESSDGVEKSGMSFMYGVEPEAGITARVSRVLQLNVTVGVLLGWRAVGGREIVSGPTASFGVRLVR